MKKIIFFILLFIANYTYSQVKVSADGGIIPTGVYPAVDGVHVRGDIHDVQSIIERNAIPTNFRRIGMLAYVIDSLKYYQLKTGIANTDWYEFKGNGDTTYTQLPLYVDTAGGIRTLKIFHPDGYEGGVVTYTGTGFDFNVSPITLYLHNKVFLFPEKTITLSPPNSLPRYDIFGVDSLGAFVKSGDTSALPIEPQIGVDSFALTKAFLISPSDTVPSVITTKIIYDENVGEWINGAIHGTYAVDFNNTDNPKHLTKSIYLSKYSNTQLYFIDGAFNENTVNQDGVIDLWFYLNGSLGNNYISALFYDNQVLAGSATLNSYNGFNKDNINNYYHVVIPFSSINWHTDKFTTFELAFSGIDTSGAKGLYVDYIRLQSGIQNIPSPTDYSNKQDSNYKRNDSLFWCAKGICKFIAKLNSCDTCIVDIHVSEDSTQQIGIRQNGDTAFVINWTGGGGVYYKSPIYRDGDTTKFKNDSLPLLKIMASADTSDMDDMGVPVWKMVKDRLSGIEGGGGVSHGVDSSAIHVGYITIAGDTAVVFSDLKGNSDTISIRLLQYWKKNLNNIYYNDGNIGLGLDTPRAKLHIQSDVSAVPSDSSGIIMSTSNIASLSNPKYSPSFIQQGSAWNTSLSASSTETFGSYVKTFSSTSLSQWILYHQTNSGTPNNVMAISNNGAVNFYGGMIVGGNFSANNITGQGITGTVIRSTASISGTGTSSVSSFYNNAIIGGSATGNSITFFDAEPTLNITGGTLLSRGFYYAPNDIHTAGTLTQVAIENTQGDNLFNSTSGNSGFGLSAGSIPATKVEINGAITFQTQAEPDDPAEGSTVEWFDGTNKKYKKNVGGTVTTGTIY